MIQKVAFPEEEKQPVGRTEMDSTAPQLKHISCYKKYLINALLTTELTPWDNSFTYKTKICNHEYICLSKTCICASLHACLETTVVILLPQRRKKLRQFLDTYQNILYVKNLKVPISIKHFLFMLSVLP